MTGHEVYVPKESRSKFNAKNVVKVSELRKEKPEGGKGPKKTESLRIGNSLRRAL